MEDTICYLNGKFLPFSECRIHVSDLQLQRGYGIFDFFRCRNGEIPWLEDYVERLFRSVSLADIDTSVTPERFLETVMELFARNSLENGGFKVIVTGGDSETLESVTGEANFIILNRPWNPPPKETYIEGVNLVKLEYVRHDPEIKTLNYFNTMQLRKKFREFNAVDVLYHNDHITEASRANLFFVKQGTIYTPATGILMGVTRKQVMGLAGEVWVEDIPTDSLYDFDEMFLTSTSRDITPVVGVEGRTIGSGKPGPVTREVMELFAKQSL